MERVYDSRAGASNVAPSLRWMALASIAVLLAGVARADLEPVAEVEGIVEYQLPNGLEVLLFADPSVSTVTVNVTYRVGSRHEGLGEAGMAHLLEHMVFKGTPSRRDIWGLLDARGARFNGTTWVDRTNYYETLPASEENLRFALELEADRMVNSEIRAEDLATEMTVVRNEFESGENDPLGVLRERMLETAYLWHPYGRPTIGNRSDIERVPVDRLRAFYRRYYQPDNAMLVVAGNFDPDFALREIQRTFGEIPRPERVLDTPYTEEPPQDGPRAVTLRRVGSVASAALTYHVPAGAHPDTAALEVLSELLTGEPSGTLYRELVPSGRASRVYSAVYDWHDPGVLIVQAELSPEGDARAVQERMIELVEQLASSISAEDVERARNKLKKDYRLALSDSRRIAIALSDAEAQGDWRLLFIARDRLDEVTAEDVQRVARRYLVGINRTTGLFLPSEEPARAEIPGRPDVAELVEGYEGRETLAQGEAFDATPQAIEAAVKRPQVGGFALALLPKATRGAIVRARLRFEYGSAESLRGHAMAAELLPELMERGTRTRDYAELRAELDRIETRLGIDGSAGRIDVSLEMPRTQLPAALRLLAEILRTPSLPEAELEVLRNEQRARVERVRSDPQGVLFDALYRALSPYPRDSVLYRPTFDETLERLDAVTRDEIAALQRELLSGDHASASFVGDFDPDALQSLLQELFGDWHTSAPYARIPERHFEIASVDRTFDTPDKEMSVVARGTSLALRDTDPDYPALDFANYVLGQSRRSRLLTELRQERGLSYGAGSFLRASSEDDVALLAAYAICAPQNAREVQRVMREEFQRWVESPPRGDDLAEFRKGYAELLKTQLADDARLTRLLLDDLQTGRPVTFHARVVEQALALEPAEIQQALRARVADAGFVDLVAGDKSRFDTPAADAR